MVTAVGLLARVLPNASELAGHLAAGLLGPLPGVLGGGVNETGDEESCGSPGAPGGGRLQGQKSLSLR